MKQITLQSSYSTQSLHHWQGCHQGIRCDHEVIAEFNNILSQLATVADS